MVAEDFFETIGLARFLSIHKIKDTGYVQVLEGVRLRLNQTGPLVCIVGFGPTVYDAREGLVQKVAGRKIFVLPEQIPSEFHDKATRTQRVDGREYLVFRVPEVLIPLVEKVEHRSRALATEEQVLVA